MFRNTFQSGVISILSAHGSHPLQLWDVCLDQSSSELQRHSGQIRRVSRSDDGHGGGGGGGGDTHHDVNQVGGPSIELSGTNLSQNCIICPPKPKNSTAVTAARRPSLGITLPYLYLTIHVPLQFDVSFEVTILDDKQITRRFRASTYQTTTVIKSDICLFPLKLEGQERRLKRDALLLPSAKKKQKVDNNPYNESYYGPGTGDDVDDDEDSEDYHCNYNKTSCWNRLCIPLSEYTRRAYGTKYVETVWVQIHANHCQLKRIYFAQKEMNGDDELPEEFRLYSSK